MDDIDRTKKYYKLTNKKHTNRKLELKKGLNIDPNFINDNIDCSPGLYFCEFKEIEYLSVSLGYDHIYDVEIPDDAIVYKQDHKYKSNKLILSNSRSIKDMDEWNDYRMCLEAVKFNGFALRYVPNKLKTSEICLNAIKYSINTLRYIPDELKTSELYLEVNKHSGALEYVPNEFKTDEMCLMAVKKCETMIEFVPDELMTEEMCLIAQKYIYIYHHPRLVKLVETKLKGFDD